MNGRIGSERWDKNNNKNNKPHLAKNTFLQHNLNLKLIKLSETIITPPNLFFYAHRTTTAKQTFGGNGSTLTMQGSQTPVWAEALIILYNNYVDFCQGRLSLASTSTIGNSNTLSCWQFFCWRTPSLTSHSRLYLMKSVAGQRHNLNIFIWSITTPHLFFNGSVKSLQAFVSLWAARS